jgi:hypothetical protein
MKFFNNFSYIRYDKKYQLWYKNNKILYFYYEKHTKLFYLSLLKLEITIRSIN